MGRAKWQHWTIAVSIISGIWASNNKGLEVTQIIKDKLLPAGGDLRFTPSNDFFGTDPDPGNTKYCGVVVEMTIGQQMPMQYAFACQEGSVMELLPDGDLALVKQADCNTQAGKPTVLESIYACGYGGLDVHSIAQAHINIGGKGIWIDPTALGYDPFVGTSKYLFVAYGTNSSDLKFKAGIDGQTLNF